MERVCDLLHEISSLLLASLIHLRREQASGCFYAGANADAGGHLHLRR